MKTTIEIPEKLFRQAKSRAALEGLSLREFFLRGLRLALQSPSGSPNRTRTAFPLSIFLMSESKYSWSMASGWSKLTCLIS